MLYKGRQETPGQQPNLLRFCSQNADYKLFLIIFTHLQRKTSLPFIEDRSLAAAAAAAAAGRAILATSSTADAFMFEPKQAIWDLL